MTVHRLLCALALTALATLPAQAAPVSALTFTGNNSSSTSIDSTRGYAFNVTAPGLVATHLSFWDQGGDGLGQSHDIGLWNPAGTLIASATIAAGTGATLFDGFRIVDIADVPLPVGNGYTVGAVFLVSSPDFQAASLTGISTAPGIQYVEARFNNNGVASLTLPTSVPSVTGIPGGSLLVDAEASAIPEPASFGMIMLGAGALLLRRVRRENRVA